MGGGKARWPARLWRRGWWFWVFPSALALAVGAFVLATMSDVAPTTQVAEAHPGAGEKMPEARLECDPGDTGVQDIFDYIQVKLGGGHPDPRTAAAATVGAETGTPVSPDEFAPGPMSARNSEQRLIRGGRVLAVADVERVPGGGWMVWGMRACLSTLRGGTEEAP